MAIFDRRSCRIYDDVRDSKILRDNFSKKVQKCYVSAVDIHQDLYIPKHGVEISDRRHKERVFPRFTVGEDISYDQSRKHAGSIPSFDEVERWFLDYMEKEAPFLGVYSRNTESESIIIRFKRNLPVFNGFWQSEDLLSWIDAIEDFFEETNPPEKVKCNIVWSKMEGAAYYWWKLLQSDRVMDGKEEIGSWPKMKKLMISRFSSARCSTKLPSQSDKPEKSKELKHSMVDDFIPTKCLTKVLTEAYIDKHEQIENLDPKDELCYLGLSSIDACKTTPCKAEFEDEYKDEKESDQMLVEEVKSLIVEGPGKEVLYYAPPKLNDLFCVDRSDVWKPYGCFTQDCCLNLKMLAEIVHMNFDPGGKLRNEPNSPKQSKDSSPSDNSRCLDLILVTPIDEVVEETTNMLVPENCEEISKDDALDEAFVMLNKFAAIKHYTKFSDEPNPKPSNQMEPLVKSICRITCLSKTQNFVSRFYYITCTLFTLIILFVISIVNIGETLDAHYGETSEFYIMEAQLFCPRVAIFHFKNTSKLNLNTYQYQVEVVNIFQNAESRDCFGYKSLGDKDENDLTISVEFVPRLFDPGGSTEPHNLGDHLSPSSDMLFGKFTSKFVLLSCLSKVHIMYTMFLLDPDVSPWGLSVYHDLNIFSRNETSNEFILVKMSHLGVGARSKSKRGVESLLSLVTNSALMFDDIIKDNLVYVAGNCRGIGLELAEVYACCGVDGVNKCADCDMTGQPSAIGFLDVLLHLVRELTSEFPYVWYGQYIEHSGVSVSFYLSRGRVISLDGWNDENNSNTSNRARQYVVAMCLCLGIMYRKATSIYSIILGEVRCARDEYIRTRGRVIPWEVRNDENDSNYQGKFFMTEQSVVSFSQCSSCLNVPCTVVRVRLFCKMVNGLDPPTLLKVGWIASVWIPRCSLVDELFMLGGWTDVGTSRIVSRLFNVLSSV